MYKAAFMAKSGREVFKQLNFTEALALASLHLLLLAESNHAELYHHCLSCQGANLGSTSRGLREPLLEALKGPICEVFFRSPGFFGLGGIQVSVSWPRSVGELQRQPCVSASPSHPRPRLQ